MTSVLVVSEEYPANSPEFDTVLSIQNLIGRTSQERFIEVMNRISALNIDFNESINYDIFWRRFSRPQSTNAIRSIVLFEELEEAIDTFDDGPDEMVCDKSVPEPYARVIEDLAEKHGIMYRRSGHLFRFRDVIHLTKFLIIFGGILAMFVDQFIAKLCYRLKPIDAELADIAFFPAINRLESTLPVLRAFDTLPSIVTTTPFLYEFISRSNNHELKPFNPVSIHSYVDYCSLIGQFCAITSVGREVTGTGPFTRKLVSGLEQEFGMKLSHTVPVLTKSTLINFRFIRAILLRQIFREYAYENSFKKIVLGTLDPVGRAIMCEALTQNIDVFHIPHSIATRFPPNPPPETIQFVSGDMDVRYYERTVPESQAWGWIPSGRPYLANLYKRFKKQSSQPKNRLEEIKILLATQDGSADIRKEFVSTVLDSLQGTNLNAQVIIKTHPDEKPYLYKQFVSDYNGVRIDEKNLFGNLLESDIVLTINSNVGLESVVMGTPCVCFNKWEPFILDLTYVLTGEIPVLRSRNALNSFFNNLSRERLKSMREGQMEFVKQNYKLDSDVAENIAQYICTA